MYIKENNNDITDFIGDVLVENEIDETEPGGVPFEPGDPLKDHRNEAIKQLNSR